MTVRKQLGLVALIPLFLAVAQAALISQSTNTVETNVQMLSLLSQVRTEVQRLTKLELCGSPSDPVLQNIDRLLGLLINGDVKQALPPASGEFAEKLKPCLGTWARIKELIPAYRAAPTSSTELVQISEQFAQQTGDAGGFVSAQAVGGGGGLRMVLVAFIGLYALVIVLFYIASKKMGTTLDASIFSLTASAGEMSSTVELQERLAADQASATNETTSTMEELLASARISAEQAETAATQSQQVLHFSQEGVDAVNQIIEGLGNLKENVTAIAQQILDLSEQIGQIGDITNAVSELASQTNMLALNAAVEAARAGQEGKGFAVVASEIRKLAEQSNRSAERIGALVAGLQKAANSTVMVTEAGTKTVDASTELAQSTQGTFDQLSAATQDAFENAQQISLNVRQQVEAVGQVLEAMNTLNASAKDSAAGIAQAQQGIAKLNETAELLESKL